MLMLERSLAMVTAAYTPVIVNQRIVVIQLLVVMTVMMTTMMVRISYSLETGVVKVVKWVSVALLCFV